MLEHPQADAVARPLDDNLFVWHANMVARLAGVPIHAVFVFPETYPTDGPEIRVFHALPHPNVSPHLAPLE